RTSTWVLPGWKPLPTMVTVSPPPEIPSAGSTLSTRRGPFWSQAPMKPRTKTAAVSCTIRFISVPPMKPRRYPSKNGRSTYSTRAPRQARRVTGMLAHAGEGTSVHPVQIQRAIQVIDLVLQDPGVPALGVDGHRLTAVVEGIDAHRQGAGDLGQKAGDAQATLGEDSGSLLHHLEAGVDDDVEGDRGAAADGQLLVGLRLL